MTVDRAAEPHPDVQSFLSVYESLDVPSFEEVTPEAARAQFEAMFARGEPSIELESVDDRTIDGPRGDLPIRIYDPGVESGTAGADAAGSASRPLVLYFHGGGWVVGSVDTHDGTCRKLADETGYPVVSVDYGLAPEHPFPEGLLDCYASLEWAADAAPELGADPDRLVLAGDSAGGSLAAGTALLARDRDGPAVAYQALIYPGTGDVTRTEAHAENGEGYFLTTEDMEWFRGHYFANEIDQGNVYALPRRAHDLSELPPATVLTAGFDPLRDDGALYAKRLESDGVSTTHRNYEDLIHGFFGMIEEPVNLDRAHEAYEDVVDDLRDALE